MNKLATFLCYRHHYYKILHFTLKSVAKEVLRFTSVSTQCNKMTKALVKKVKHALCTMAHPT